jgi:hypothetical protein
MRRLPSVAFVGLALLAGSRGAIALDYRSVTEATAMYDAPSVKASPLFVVRAGTPVELVVSLEGWSKVRDSKGDLVWIEKKHLAEKRNVIVRSRSCADSGRRGGQGGAGVRSRAGRGAGTGRGRPRRLGQGRHRDGQDGFVKAPQVWGL